MNLQLIILLVASRLSLNAALNDLEKQVASLRINLDKQDAELKQLKRITEIQNEKISLLNELNEGLQQQLQNQSTMIDDLQNQQDQLQNTTNQNLPQGNEVITEPDGGRFQQEIYQLLNVSSVQQIQIEYLMDQGKELRKSNIIIQEEINAIDMKFLNITDDQYDQITNLTEKFEDTIQLDTKRNNILFSTFNKSINEQRNEIVKISNVIDYSKYIYPL